MLIQSAMVAEDNVIRDKDIPVSHDDVQKISQADLSLKESMERLKMTMIQKALKDNDGNKTKAGTQLGMTRQNLQNMLRRMKIT